MKLIEGMKDRLNINDFIDVIVIGSGLNYYKRIAWNNAEVKINDFTYKISRNKLFIAPRNPFLKAYDWIRRRRNLYKIVFLEDEAKAVELPPSSRKDPPSDILFIAERSDALKKGLEDLFRETILSRKVILFILIAIGIFAFAYLYLTDQLPEIPLP